MNVTKSFVVPLIAAALAIDFGPGFRAQVPPRSTLLDFETAAPRLVERDGQTAMALEGYGHAWRLELRENRALVDSLSPVSRAQIRKNRSRFYMGQLAGAPGSWARVNRIAGRLTAMFFDGRTLYLVDRAAAFELPPGRRAERGATVMFRYSDLAPGLFDHGALEVPGSRRLSAAQSERFDGFVGHLREVARLSGEAEFAMPVTIVSDTQFSATHGADAAAVVAGRMNFIDGIYASQLGTAIALLHHEILDDNGPLTSTNPSVLLSDQFGPFMRNGAGSDIPFDGLAHLFTGRDLNGGSIGIAYLRALCSSGSGYGVNQNLNSDTTSALLVAHELGHNFGAGHDDDTDSCPVGTFRGIMNSSINGAEEFSQCSLDAMSAEVATVGCLIENPGTEPIFADGFESP